MTRMTYRTLIVSSALTAVAAAVLALTETWNWAVALLALAVAQLPALLHLQTRRFVTSSNTVASRSLRTTVGGSSSTPTDVSASEFRTIQGSLARLEAAVAAQRTVDTTPHATGEAPVVNVPSAQAPAAEDETGRALLELRRELRMTRLLLADRTPSAAEER